MHKKLLFLFLFLFVEIINAQQNVLSEQAEISILTIGPGSSLNDSFGHSAFRVRDYIKGTDLVFNYGVYDFDTPNFYTKFAQGKLNYLIGVNYFQDFFEAYISQNRSIKEQVLNLSAPEKQKLFNYLLNNIKPENRAYLYDFFYDNCATKIKDVLNQSTSNAIQFNPPKDFKPQTFRTLIQDKLDWNSWGSLGIDIALGSVIDRKATAEEHMFLPAYIHTFFDHATFKDNNTAIVGQSILAYKQTKQPKSNYFLMSPIVVFGLIGLFILLITYKDFNSNQRNKWLDLALFSITGIVGVVILLLWFATDHKATHQNYNLLWACALNLFVIGQLYRKIPKNWFIKYLKFLIILFCLLTLHWILGVQVFAFGLIPLLIALIIRYLYLIKYYTKGVNSQ